MFCSRCGSQVDPAEGFCSKCGTPAASIVPAPAAAVAPQAATIPAAQPVAAEPRVIVIKTQKNPGVAAVLSFFWTGLGQIYNGQIGMGVLLMICYVISWWLMFVVIGFITTPILWIYGMVDTYKTAERLNMGQLR